MASKVICLVLLGSAAADPNEASQLGKAMAKFAVPAARPVINGHAVANPSVQAAMTNTLADLEQQSQEMKVEYQRLRARIQQLPQADVEASVSASSSFRWLAALAASVGLAASFGVAALRKYTGQGQQGSESATTFQVPLVVQAPQRAGPIVATATVDDALEETPAMPEPDEDNPNTQEKLKDLAKRINPAIGFYDPLRLSEKEFWGQSNEATIGWLRNAEMKHGRVAMAGFVGYIIHENHIHWPWKGVGFFEVPLLAPNSEEGRLITANMKAWPEDWYQPFENLSAPDIWFNLPAEDRIRVIFVCGLFELWSESSWVRKKEGQKHYMRGGKPGFFPTFEDIPHPVPLDLYDPFGFNKDKSEEWKRAKLVSEINNGRLAMIGLMSFLCEAKTPGSVPWLEGKITPMSEGLQVMAPFGTPATSWEALTETANSLGAAWTS